jgi:uncharacterized protein (DUF1778 family)
LSFKASPAENKIIRDAAKAAKAVSLSAWLLAAAMKAALKKN